MFCPIRCLVNMEKNYAIPRCGEKNYAIPRSAKKKILFPGKTPPPPGLTMDGPLQEFPLFSDIIKNCFDLSCYKNIFIKLKFYNKDM